MSRKLSHVRFSRFARNVSLSELTGRVLKIICYLWHV
jgi:hypothetical protein